MDHVASERRYDPRVGADRIEALLCAFTAPINECPFYDKQIRSTCALDPSSRRAWDCQGICFENGFCCNHVIAKSTEIEELLKVLRSFAIRKQGY
jgi:hypothetical protein